MAQSHTTSHSRTRQKGARRGTAVTSHLQIKSPDTPGVLGPGSVPPIGDLCAPEFFRILANPHREVYWRILAVCHDRKFLGSGREISRPEAIDLAQRAFLDLEEEGRLLSGFDLAEPLTNLPTVDDDIPQGGRYRQEARLALRSLIASGWIYFQTYANTPFPVLSFTVLGQRQVAHLLRELRGERLPLRSAADRLNELVNVGGRGCDGMRLHAGRLPQLRDVVAHLNERIHEMLGGIKRESEDVLQRASTVREILQDLLESFQKKVGRDYYLLQRDDSPPRLWDAVRAAVDELRDDGLWLMKEANWYNDEFALHDIDEARLAVLADLEWIDRVMDGLQDACVLLDERYARYITLARQRVTARLRQAHNLADGVRALLDAAATDHIKLVNPRFPHALAIGPVGFSLRDGSKSNEMPPAFLEVTARMTPEEAAAQRTEDAIPLRDIVQWLREHGARDGTVHVDDLPLETMDDYLRHIYAGRYGSERKVFEFEPIRCSGGARRCGQADTCSTCIRRSGRFTVPRGLFRFLKSKKDS